MSMDLIQVSHGNGHIRRNGFPDERQWWLAGRTTLRLLIRGIARITCIAK